jgi:Ser-tRNA(Ala) deacylase AlaX
MAYALYLSDSYLRNCHSKVSGVIDGRFILLDNGLFSPRGGGLPSDTGKLLRKSDGAVFSVLSVVKKDGLALHELDKEGLAVGDEVECSLDWGRRHRLMRMHTAGHILSAIMYKSGGILITGNSIDTDKSRFDFSMENFDREAFQRLIDQANSEIARNLDVTISYLAREEALKLPGMVKLAGTLPPEVRELRIVKIGDVDEQADGGVHVKNTREIGKIVFLGAENKGKSNRRVYFALEP